jgi:hypothetical protein
MKVSRKVMIAATVAIAGTGGQAAQAAMCSNPFNQLTPMCLTDTVANNGTANTVTDPNGSTTLVNAVTTTSSYFLGDQFNPGPVNANLSSPNGSWNFYDSFVFTLASGSTAQGALMSFNLGPGLVGIGPLQARIVEVPAGTYVNNGNYDSAALNNLGSFGTTAIDGWTTDQEPAGSGFYQVMLNQHPLTAGEYVLQVRGDVAEGTGAANGSYSGTLSFITTPLPASFWTLLSGLGVLAAWFGLRPAPLNEPRPA